MNNEQELKAHLQDSNKARMYEEKRNKLKKYRVIKEFFVDAHDEYEAETKAEDNKIKLSCNLIDVHEIDEDEVINNEHKKKEDEMVKNWKDEIAINKGGQ